MVCEFCQYTVVNLPIAGVIDGGPLPPGPAEERWSDAARPRAAVAGQRYVVLGRIARGEGCDLFLGRSDRRLTEMVVLKVVRALADTDLLEREWRVLEELSRSDARGADYFSGLLPQRVAHGTVETPGGTKRKGSVFRWRSGFVHTFEDITRVYPCGVDSQTAVWLWKRTLELLGWVHRSGYAHGAVLPWHLLVHPRDHGVVLVGWSSASRYQRGERSPAVSEAGRDYYPEALWSGAPPDPESDIFMSARCLIRVLGGDPARGTLPEFVPERLAALIIDHAAPDRRPGRSDDAWELKERVSDAARQAFGLPRYHPFRMPGWG